MKDKYISSAVKFKKYIQKVREQLNCNATDEYKNNYVTYLYTNEEVNNNLRYFRKCMKAELSPYKALLFFGDYLNGDTNIEEWFN